MPPYAGRYFRRGSPYGDQERPRDIERLDGESAGAVTVGGEVGHLPGIKPGKGPMAGGSAGPQKSG